MFTGIRIVNLVSPLFLSSFLLSSIPSRHQLNQSPYSSPTIPPCIHLPHHIIPSFFTIPNRRFMYMLTVDCWLRTKRTTTTLCILLKPNHNGCLVYTKGLFYCVYCIMNVFIYSFFYRIRALKSLIAY